MRTRRPSFSTMNSKTVVMEGGINENVSSIEMKGGELISCLNYHIFEGSQGGYVSTKGYERYDGNTAPSSVFASEADETDREAARANITEVPGSGAVLGIHIYQGKVYAFRNAADGLTAAMYVESPTGWTLVQGGFDPDGNYEFENYNFYATTSPGFTETMYWVDGVNTAHYYDGTSVVAIVNSGMGVNDKPTRLAIHNERLFLAYPGGSLQYSNVGDPTDWAAGVGELGVGSDITNLVSTVGNALMIYCGRFIYILTGSGEDTDWSLESFSNSEGAYVQTAIEFLGSVYFTDTKGVTSLAAAQEYGAFSSNNITQKIYKTFQRYKEFITVATVERNLNQYRLYFSNGYGMYFSFFMGRLRGVTLVRFPDAVMKITEGEDSEKNKVIFFASNSGYVYKMDSGTSFDGEVIDTKLTSSFYHYGSPRNWKRFRSITFEIASDSNNSFVIREYYDYRDSYLPRASTQEFDTDGSGAVYGDPSSVYGVSIYSSGGITDRVIHYIKGLGSNMGFSLSSSSKFNQQHNVQNFTTDFEVTRRQL